MTPRTDLPNAAPSLGALFLSFLKIALSSFGGGTSAWVHREIVETRGWMSDQQYLTTLTVAQVLPGANPVNVSVYIGLELRGGPGALVAGLGMVLPSFLFILILAAAYGALGGHPGAQAVLAGLASVGIAAMLVAGMKTAGALKGDRALVLVAIATFVAVGVLRLPLIPAALMAAAISVALSYRASRAG